MIKWKLKKNRLKNRIRERMGNLKTVVFLYQNTKKLIKGSVHQRISRCFDPTEKIGGNSKTNCLNGIVRILKRESLTKKTWQSGKVQRIKIQWSSNRKSAQNLHRKIEPRKRSRDIHGQAKSHMWSLPSCYFFIIPIVWTLSLFSTCRFPRF